MKLLVPRESDPEEHRVAATPETVSHLSELGATILAESGAGAEAGFSDGEYVQAGAAIAGTDAWAETDGVLKVGPASADEAGRLRRGGLLVGLLEPDRHLDAVRVLAEREATALALELVPRITRAQSMDALSSQASIAGYKAVVLAASRLGRYFPLLMTAAGTVPPAKVVVIGAGVAGLQAIATAKRLGALVEVSDVRPAVKEQVESLGGRYIDVPDSEAAVGEGGYAKEVTQDFLNRQREILTQHIAAADVVITTALVPGRPAPRIVSQAMIAGMKPGSVVVDIAAPRGGNCEPTCPGEEVVHNGVLILGPVNLPATMAHDASTLYARNIQALVELVLTDGELAVDPEDEILAGCLLTHQGKVAHAATRELLQEKVS